MDLHLVLRLLRGGTTMLIKALEDSGWFIPIERENLSNLSTERNIIRNTKQEYIKNLNPNEPPLPKDDFGPYIYAGPGYSLEIGDSNLNNEAEDLKSGFFKIQYGLGLQYFISEKFGLKVFAEHNILFDDKLDNLVNGKRDDYYYNFGIGLNYYFATSSTGAN